jgi:hypothetical protein
MSTYHPNPGKQYKIFHRASQLISQHAGIQLNASKSWLLLQPGAVTPPKPPDGLNITHEGIILVGAPIGIDNFIQTHTHNLVNKLAEKIEIATHMEPQLAHILLTKSFQHGLGYAIQVTSPKIIEKELAIHDCNMDKYRDAILSKLSMNRKPKCSKEIQLNEDNKARKHLLAPEIDFCLNHIRKEITPSSVDILELLPKYASEMWRKPPTPKIRRRISDAMHKNKKDELISRLTMSEDIKNFSTSSDRHLVYSQCPSNSSKSLDTDAFISSMRFYLGLPQMLHLEDTPVKVQACTPMEYEAIACRYHEDQICDRHINHGHSCSKSSSTKKKDRHEMVKHVRSDLITMVGYTDKRMEPRTNKELHQRRADLAYTDKTNRGRHIHYFTDDTIGHPLCKSHIANEMKDLTAQATIKTLVKNKAKHYADFIRRANTHPAVNMKTVVINYKTIAFTSLGEMGEGAIKFFNGCLSHYKTALIKDIRRTPRADGLTAKELTAKLRFDFRTRIQFAIAQGNAAIATSVGF